MTVTRFGAGLYPPSGKVMHIAGQTVEGIDDYVRNVCCDGSACKLPAGLAAYTGFWGDHLFGIQKADSVVPGDEHQHLAYLAEHYPDAAFQLALFFTPDQLTEAAQCRLDEPIGRLADAVRELDRPTYLRIGFEFDGPHNRYPPSAFQDAWRRAVDVFSARGASNVAYVWHSFAWTPTYEGRDPFEWWPGDAYVDWIGISLFGFVTGHNRDRMLEIARDRNLPMMISESSAARQALDGTRLALNGQEYWDYWYARYFDFIEGNPEVQAFSIINADWDSQKQMQQMNCQWGDCRLKVDDVVLDRWRAKMTDPRYLHQTPDITDILSGTLRTDEAQQAMEATGDTAPHGSRWL
ncbi:hypothetical protein ACFLSJ_02640 [Verrucomicrobiota bacterium]